MIGFITGSGFYEFPGLAETVVETRFGEVRLLAGEIDGRAVCVLPRHGTSHRNLPHQINHRANLLALKDAGVSAVVSCSVCGIINPDWDIGRPIVADDLWFPENRLGDGTTCTVFDTPGEPGRGHLLASSFFNRQLGDAIASSLSRESGRVESGCYAHGNGPRFNSVAEIRALRAAGADFLSQTCGPEAVLANECELPYALAGFGVDYANGVKEEPTPVECLQENLVKSQKIFESLIRNLTADRREYRFENFVYRFE